MDIPICDECRFCALAHGHPIQPFYDSPVLKSPGYRVLPSLGSIVPGWTLIIPRQHHLNMSTHYDDPEFTQVRLRVATVLKERLRMPVRVFEHGATQVHSSTGCGVDHAHVHVVPLKESLLRTVGDMAPDLTWVRVAMTDVMRYAGDAEYLWYADDATQQEPQGMLAVLPAPRSQFFRRAIAANLGMPARFDYRADPFVKNIESTYAILGDLGSDSALQ